jgi:Na+-driven multidrug efflux pump
VALRWSLLVVVVVAALPLLAALAPDFVSGNLLGVRWFWLVLGFAAYPALLLVGWRFIRHAERVEQDFADMVDN